MFKLSMCCALFSMTFLLRRTKLKFNRYDTVILFALLLYLLRHFTRLSWITLLKFLFLRASCLLFLSFLFLSCKFLPLSLFLYTTLPSLSLCISLRITTAPSKKPQSPNNFSLIKKIYRDWFMRLCGLMLDLLFIAALSKAYPKPKNLEETHYVICSGFVLVCFVWNILCFFFIAKKVFPNFWFERGLVLAADCLGHSYTGTCLRVCVSVCACVSVCVCVCVCPCV
jgi:hypothetical protein